MRPPNRCGLKAKILHPRKPYHFVVFEDLVNSPGLCFLRKRVRPNDHVDQPRLASWKEDILLFYLNREAAKVAVKIMVFVPLFVFYTSKLQSISNWKTLWFRRLMKHRYCSFLLVWASLMLMIIEWNLSSYPPILQPGTWLNEDDEKTQYVLFRPSSAIIN